VPSEPVGPVKPVDRVVPVAIRGQKDNGNSADPDFFAERRQQCAADSLPGIAAGHADAAEQRGMGHIDRSFSSIAKRVEKLPAHAKRTEKQRNQAGKQKRSPSAPQQSQKESIGLRGSRHKPHHQLAVNRYQADPRSIEEKPKIELLQKPLAERLEKEPLKRLHVDFDDGIEVRKLRTDDPRAAAGPWPDAFFQTVQSGFFLHKTGAADK
jgi:hypothetical protein